MAENISPKMELIATNLVDSLMLSTPLISQDPVYVQLQDNIPNIIKMSCYGIGKESVDELTPEEVNIVYLKSLYTIYLRLAVSVAPEFDASAEQVTFKKGDRVFHYTTLADKVKAELDSALSNNLNIEVRDLILRSKDGSLRNYNLSKEQEVRLKVNSVGENSLELEWNRYDLMKGNFRKYTLMYSDRPIYDEYSSPVIREGDDITTLDFYDIRRIKYRLTGLKKGITYYIVLIFYSRDLGKSVGEIAQLVGDSDE